MTGWSAQLAQTAGDKGPGVFPLGPMFEPQPETVERVATRLSIFEGYSGVLIVAFVVTLLATPLLRRLAVANGVIDRPTEARKVHRMPVAYLGGVAVYLGMLAGIFFALLSAAVPALLDWHTTKHLSEADMRLPVPVSVMLGMTVIVLVGVIDDVTGISPRVKIGGQLFAAAALAVDNVGVKLAAGLLKPIGSLIGNPDLVYRIPLPFAL